MWSLTGHHEQCEFTLQAFYSRERLVWICVLNAGPGSSVAADSEGAEAGGRETVAITQEEKMRA